MENPLGFELFQKLDKVIKESPKEITIEEVLQALAFASAKAIVRAGEADREAVDGLGRWFVDQLQNCCEKRIEVMERKK